MKEFTEQEGITLNDEAREELTNLLINDEMSVKLEKINEIKDFLIDMTMRLGENETGDIVKLLQGLKYVQETFEHLK